MQQNRMACGAAGGHKNSNNSMAIDRADTRDRHTHHFTEDTSLFQRLSMALQRGERGCLLKHHAYRVKRRRIHYTFLLPQKAYIMPAALCLWALI